MLRDFVGFGRLPKPRLQVERARQMKREGCSMREIAVALKIPRSTVSRALRA